MTASSLGVGIIGCGNISETYLRLAPLFRSFHVVGLADLDEEVARRRAEQFGTMALSVDDLLARDDIAILVNLTIPQAHHAVTRQILEAGKHAYSEKPFVLNVDDGMALQNIAQSRGLRIGSAPDTFLGGSHQQARALVDDGAIGTVIAGTCHMMNHGMESWHPNPDFFFKAGGGPILDMGPYYITNLVQLLGPVRAVMAQGAAPTQTRVIGSGARAGQTVPVETPTTVHALLTFEQGAAVTLSMSWDIWAHRHAPMELYGTNGSLFLPDPNFFGGPVRHANRDGAIETLSAWDHPLGVANEKVDTDPRANYRAIGLADMADAILSNRPHRCSFDLALHSVEVMTAILRSAESQASVPLETGCARPAPLAAEAARALMAVPERSNGT